MYENSNQPEKMRTRYQELPPEITELFEYGTVDVVLGDITDEFALNDDQKESLRMEIELVLYCFLPRTGMVERIKESLTTEEAVAERIAARIEEDLFVMVDDLLTTVEKQFNGTENKLIAPDKGPATIGETGQPEETPVASAQVETSEAQSNVKPLRTFAEDVEISRAHSYGAFRSGDDASSSEEDEPVYHSSQDDIIKK